MSKITENIDSTIVNCLGPQVISELTRLLKYRDLLDCDLVISKAAQLVNQLNRPAWQDLMGHYQELPTVAKVNSVSKCLVNCNQATVSVGAAENLSSDEREALRHILWLLKPWRKGPLNIFGVEIDAEWRSDLKWARILPELGDLRGKRVADLGCSNGYYMFRALDLDPECIIGFEPYESNYFAYHLIQRFWQDERLCFLRMGVEELGCFPKFFDVVLCMGLIYHQKDPLSLLKNIYEAMTPGGLIILESQGFSSSLPLALFPFDRYAQMRNTYYVPSAPCMKAWLERAGFRSVEVFSEEALEQNEQRATFYGPEHSLIDCLDPNDNTKTIEGYPAPLRIAAKGYK